MYQPMTDLFREYSNFRHSKKHAVGLHGEVLKQKMIVSPSDLSF